MWNDACCVQSLVWRKSSVGVSIYSGPLMVAPVRDKPQWFSRRNEERHKMSLTLESLAKPAGQCRDRLWRNGGNTCKNKLYNIKINYKDLDLCSQQDTIEIDCKELFWGGGLLVGGNNFKTNGIIQRYEGWNLNGGNYLFTTDTK